MHVVSDRQSVQAERRPQETAEVQLSLLRATLENLKKGFAVRCAHSVRRGNEMLACLTSSDRIE